MTFTKGNTLGQKTWWKPGQSGNPRGSSIGAVTARTAGLRLLLDLADRVLGDPQVQADFEAWLRKTMRKNPPAALRMVGGFLPRETQSTLTRNLGGTLEQLSVSQLKRIAGMVEEPGTVIDMVEGRGDAD